MVGVWAVGAGYNDFDIIFPEPPSLSPSLSLFLPSLSSLFSLSLFPLAPPLSVFSLPSFSRTRFWGTACSFRAIQAPHWVTLLAAAVPVRQLHIVLLFRSISHTFLTHFSRISHAFLCPMPDRHTCDGLDPLCIDISHACLRN